jgi:hypothetical protein
MQFLVGDDVTDALHTVAMRKTRDGKYELFNYKSNDENDSEEATNLKYKLMFNGEIPLSIHCISK